MKTELEICRGLSDKELAEKVRNLPTVDLIPSITVLLERFEVRPETNPEPAPTRKRCEFCCGTGKGPLNSKCKHCNGEGVDLT